MGYGTAACFVNKVLLEHNHTLLFVYCLLAMTASSVTDGV